ncbi:MAG: DMT family transporter, partial [Candidatus Cloacimonadaceae bacterium]
MASAIWGFAFVAQRKGNESMHPLLFNSLRFALGALALLPFATHKSKLFRPAKASWDMKLFLLGFILFIAASLQQIGMLWTGAGNAGFITGLYVVFVPLIGLFRGQKPAKFIL